VVVGDRDHPEVIGVNGWCADCAVVIGQVGEVETIPAGKPICVVAQTTIRKPFFTQVCDAIKARYPNALVFDTICSATSVKQKEAEQLARSADAMVVIGGYNSSNTNKLADICRQACKIVIRCENADDIDLALLNGCETIGVTAGASTPEQIILEVINRMENAAEKLEKSLDDFKTLKVGDIVTGEIIAVNDNEVYLNIGYKSDGVIKKSDFLMDLYSELTSIAAVGDKVEAMIIDTNDGTGNVSLSKLKVDEIAAQKEIEAKYESKETIHGKIIKIVKGGVMVDIGFTKAFMPGNQYALRYVEDLNTLLGKEIDGRIIEYDASKNKIIFSRKVILQEQLTAKKNEEARIKTEAIAKIEVGQTVTAPVKNIADFGIFVDLGGIDGFIHVSDLSWKRVANPNSFCKVGDMIQAVITEMDADNYKIKLSIKDLSEEPWSVFEKQYKIGDVIEGTVRSTVKFGAFVEIIPMVEGLIHISNVSHDKIDSIESVLKPGQKVKCKIMEIDKTKRKIGLSIKDLTEAPRRKIESDKLYYKEESKTTMEDAFKKYLDN
jgi:4-hydroxy-3-methylbut-2-enyl diphosphate reductase